MNHVIDKTIAETLTQFAKDLESEASALLGAEGLGHITPKTEIKKGLLGVDFILSFPGYSIYIEHGVKGVENIPEGAEESPFRYKHLGASTDMINSIKSWASRKGLEPKPKALKATNTRKKLKDTVSDPKTAMAFAIATSVKKRGLSPKKVMQKTLTDERLQNLADDLATKVGEEVAVQLVNK